MFPKFAQGLKKKSQQVKPIIDDDKRWQQFQHWYATKLGKRLLRSEKRILEQCLPDLFGYYLLQCGCPEVEADKMPGDWLKCSRVSSRFCLDLFYNQGVSCQAQSTQLPIKSDSLDIVVLPHVLEFSSEPHQILRETERVLIAEGHVVILGFNPWSIWNIFRLFLFWSKQAPWNAQIFTASRVIDWLALLGFDVIERKGYFYRPPIQQTNIIKKLAFLKKIGRRFWPNLGAGYVLVARKRVETLTPIRPRWRTQRQVLANGLESMNRKKL